MDIINRIRYPKGFINNALMKFDFNNSITERVVPHEGHAKPVTDLIMQVLNPISEYVNTV